MIRMQEKTNKQEYIILHTAYKPKECKQGHLLTFTKNMNIPFQSEMEKK